MNTPESIRLFVVDDHPVVRAGLRTVEEMSSHIRIVGDAGHADDALIQMARLKPDVVLLDIRLQGTSGIELCRQIQTMLPATRVLILTSYVDEQLILSALEAGADGYLLKESDTRRLVNAITEVHRGEAVFDPEVTRQLANRKTGAGGRPAESLTALTAQELRLLAEVAKGKTDKEAAAELGLTAKTARNYLDRIFAKLGVHTRTEAATAYIRAGKRVWDAP
jgi:DNA-binding NarL/FixJ family response regulator